MGKVWHYFWFYFWLAFIGGTWSYVSSAYSLNGAIDRNGQTLDIYDVGVAVFQCMICVYHFLIILEIRAFNAINVAFIILSILFWIY